MTYPLFSIKTIVNTSHNYLLIIVESLEWLNTFKILNIRSYKKTNTRKVCQHVCVCVCVRVCVYEWVCVSVPWCVKLIRQPWSDGNTTPAY